MKNPKKLAIYLDHSKARLFNFGKSAIEFKTIESNFDYQDKQEIIQKGESHLHNKEQQLVVKYYENIGNAILDYDEVVLFGLTNAKTELFNFLMESNKFNKINFKVKTSDKLTDNQLVAFVNDCFLN